MKNGIIKRLIIICLALAVVLSGTTVNANIVLSKNETTKYTNTIAHRQMSVVNNPTFGSAGGEWCVMGLARAGKITNSYKEKYKKNLKKELDKTKGELSKTNFTSYSRVVLALTSISENPFNFKGYDVISPLAEYENVAKQGLNGAVYALLALDCGGYTNVSPRAGYDGKTGNSEKYKNGIVDAALPKGGWTLYGKKADVDMTAITIQALAPYYKEKKVKTVVDEGLSVLSKMQKTNGGFDSMWDENCESSAQVLAAVSTLGISIKDKRFVKNKHTILDGLMSYYKNGAFKHLKSGDVNQMSTDQAFYALVAYRNNLANDPPLFNMKKVAVKKKYRKPAKQKSRQIETKAENNIEKDNSIDQTETKKNKKDKKRKKEKITNTIQPTTVNIVKGKADKKNEETHSYWWIWIIVAMVVSITLSFIIFKKRS